MGKGLSPRYEMPCSCERGTILIEYAGDDGAFNAAWEEPNVLRACFACGGTTVKEEDPEEVSRRMAEIAEKVRTGDT